MAAIRTYTYPVPNINAASASVGAVNSTAPTSADLIGAINVSGNLKGLTTTLVSTAQSLDVNVSQSVLPSGAATSAKQDTGNTSVASIDTKTPALGQALAAASVPVVLTAAQLTTLTPTAGVATAAKQDTGNTSLASIDTKTPALGQALAAASVPVVLTAAQISTLTPLTTVASTQSGTWNITNVSGTVSLPTGAATSAAQTTAQTSLTSIDTKTPALGQALAAASVPVVLTTAQLSTLTPLATVASTQSGTWTVQPGNTANTTAWLIKAGGKASANAPARNDYTSTSVTTGAYVQLVASTTSATTEIEIFDSSGQTLVLATGAAASEVNQINIFPGGNGRIPLAIPAGTRVSIKAVSATASVGEINLNFYG